MLGASFKDVKAKFYDVIIRTDVGNVDVSWSQKEDADDDVKRLNLSRQRELKQLKDEFKDILDGVHADDAERRPAPVRGARATRRAAGSPDKGAGRRSGQARAPTSRRARRYRTCKPDAHGHPAGRGRARR